MLVGRIGQTVLKMVSVYIFIFVTVFDPSNQIFQIKELSFAATFLCLLVFNKPSLPLGIFYFLIFIVVMVLYGSLLAFLGIYKFYEGYPATFAKAFLFLALMVVASFHDIRQPFNQIMVLLACFIVLVFCVNILGGIGPIKPEAMLLLTNWLTSGVGAAMIGERAFGDLSTPMIYYKSSPLLAIALAYSLDRRAYFLSALFGTALFLSGTRADMLFAILIPCIYVYIDSGARMRFAYAIFFLVGIFLAVPFLVQNFLDPSEQSNSIKMAHLSSYGALFAAQPFVLLFGSGIGALFYTTAHNSYVFQTELVYLDLLRYFGLPILSVFIFFLLCPAYLIYRNLSKIIAIGYLAYLAISSTNPLLISSTGMLATTFAYLYAFKNSVADRGYRLCPEQALN
jgi:hypothetical protein